MYAPLDLCPIEKTGLFLQWVSEDLNTLDTELFPKSCCGYIFTTLCISKAMEAACNIYI